MDEVLIGVLTLLVAMLVVGGAAAALLALTVARAVTATRLRVLDGTDRAKARVRAYGVGPAADVARLQVQLRAGLDDVRGALACATSARVPVGDARSLVRRLETAAADLDAQLRAAALERDPARLAEVLPTLRARTASVTGSAAQVRRGLLDSALRLGEDELRALGADCALEARALGTRVRAS